jgi:tetratricopeptide (TPR) repeat protein
MKTWSVMRKGLCCILLTLMPIISAQAETAASPSAPVPAGQRFEQALATLIEGDEARRSGNMAMARDRYENAYEAYRHLSKAYPDWDPAVVKFRMTYCRNQMEALGKVVMPPRTPNAAQQTPRVAWPSVENDEMRSVIGTAVDFLREGNVEAADEILREALRAAPEHAVVRLLIGIARCQAGAFEEAERLLNRLCQDQPRNAHAWTTLGVARAGRGLWLEARKAFEQATNLNPALRQAHYNLAEACLASDPPDMQTARKHYKRAMDLGAVPDKALEALLAGEPEGPAAQPTP